MVETRRAPTQDPSTDLAAQISLAGPDSPERGVLREGELVHAQEMRKVIVHALGLVPVC